MGMGEAGRCDRGILVLVAGVARESAEEGLRVRQWDRSMLSSTASGRARTTPSQRGAPLSQFEVEAVVAMEQEEEDAGGVEKAPRRRQARRRPCLEAEISRSVGRHLVFARRFGLDADPR